MKYGAFYIIIQSYKKSCRTLLDTTAFYFISIPVETGCSNF